MKISGNYFINNINAVPKSLPKISFGNSLSGDTFEFSGSSEKTHAASEEQKTSEKLRSEIIAEQIAERKAKEAEINEDFKLMHARKFVSEGISPSPDFMTFWSKKGDLRAEIKALEKEYIKVRSKELEEDEKMLNYDDFRKTVFGKLYKKNFAQRRIPDEMINRWAKNGYIVRENAGPGEPFYIDSSNERNKETIEILNKKLPYSSDFIQFKFKYNLTEDKLRSLVASGKVTPVLERNDEIKQSSYFLIDDTSEETQNTIKTRNKLVPFPSLKFYKRHDNMNDIWVSVNYLSKLGFGEPSVLTDAINNNKLCGRRITKETPEGKKSALCVNIADDKTENELAYLKEINPDVVTPRQLANRLQMKPKEMEEALLNGEAEIIKRYIFESDSSKVYINTADEKNAAFIDRKNLENELIRSEKASKKRKNDARKSARMKLIWHFCPETKAVASREAVRFPEIKAILDKKSDNTEENLDGQEEETVKKYFKSVWTAAGTEEFHAAIKQADEQLRILDQFGIDAIADEEIKNILSGRR